MMDPAQMVAGNPWFRRWPRGRTNPLAQTAPAATVLKPIQNFVREANYPPKFVQVIPFQLQPIAPGMTESFSIKLDDDFPFRLDSIVLQCKGPAMPEAFASVLVILPSGRRLTRRPVDPWAFNGLQGGRDFIPFRHRFQPSDVITLEVSNSHATTSLDVRGFIYGYKLTPEART